MDERIRVAPRGRVRYDVYIGAFNGRDKQTLSSRMQRARAIIAVPANKFAGTVTNRPSS